jgi:1-pyrroline-5-carboxylate dehydrogenase
MLLPYTPEPFTDFSQPDQLRAFEQALAKVKSELGQTYPLHIGKEKIYTDDVFPSINPARPSEVLGYFAMASVKQVNQAVEAATKAFESWQHVRAEDRARYLLRAAAELRRRKHEFSATMVLEVGKSWVEADVETAEAIDFLEYYARQMVRLDDSSHLLAPYPGEQLQLRYIPMGVTAVIPPWNFPCAILGGMTSAALVAGNSVLLKPAEQSPWIGYKVAQLFWEQDLPPGVLNFLTGDGPTVGGRMVEHPKTRIISFTGSRPVGVMIHEKAAKVGRGQTWLKRTVLEMGGKDAVVVDETADLALAAQGIVASAFGFQGQKCSAGSRAIIVQSIYDEVVERAVHLTQQLSIGTTDASATVYMGPVIDEEAMNKILGYIAYGRQHYPTLHGGAPIESDTNGYFIAPTIFGDVPSTDKLGQEEIFGPVLAMIPAKNYQQALTYANSTEYGLTGAVYSRSRERLEQARREFHVGNLYLNRKCTGAIVGVHPFGGFNMSGTDSKAGGPDYLLLFTQAKSIAEKL